MFLPTSVVHKAPVLHLWLESLCCFLYDFVSLFLTVLTSLLCGLFSSFGHQRLLFLVVHRLLIAVASRAAKTGSGARGLLLLWLPGLEPKLSSGTRAWLL